MATAIAPMQAVRADERCLIGKWQAENETLNQSSSVPSIAAAEWSVAGDLLIEIMPSADVRLVYTDYVVSRKTGKASFDVLLEARYRGSADGRLAPYGGGEALSLKSFGDVSRSVRQRIGGGDWIDADDGDETPPHEGDGYVFECEGDALTLSRTDAGPFGGSYTGRFVRVD